MPALLKASIGQTEIRRGRCGLALGIRNISTITNGHQRPDTRSTINSPMAINPPSPETLAAMRDAMLPKLLSGELRVPAAD